MQFIWAKLVVFKHNWLLNLGPIMQKVIIFVVF